MRNRPNIERAITKVATFRPRGLKLRYRGQTGRTMPGSSTGPPR